MQPPLSQSAAIEAIIREEWGRILSSLQSRFSDLQLAEDCLQDAVEAALRKWPDQGVPKNPAAWLVRAAQNKAVDRLRRAQNFKTKEAELSYLADLENNGDVMPGAVTEIADKRLEMLFTCCHPALAQKSRVALTLRTIGGLTTEEIAAAFLDKPTAMAQRLVRAKKKIKLAGIPYQIPQPCDLPERLKGVMSVIYLIFNEGYSASKDEAVLRTHLTDEAIRLARILSHLLPEATEVRGLLALMLLHDARRPARLDGDGHIVPLEFQDRSLWSLVKANEGRALIKETLTEQKIGPYQLQAAISAVHIDARVWDETDWPQIAALYDLLYAVAPSPVVKLNQAVAISYSKSPQAALAVLSGANIEEMAGYQPFHAAKGDFLLRAGCLNEARAALDMAIALSGNAADKRFLEQKRLLTYDQAEKN